MNRVVYIFDDINYISGAQKVMLYQIKELSKYYHISILSLTQPSPKIIDQCRGIEMIDSDVWNIMQLRCTGLKEVLNNRNISLINKIKRIMFAFENYLGLPNRNFNKYIQNILSGFDTVCIVSEASKVRECVANSAVKTKIQWIHTDYKLWSGYSAWTRSITSNDVKIYKKFDHIVVLSENSKKGICEKLPEIQDKVDVVPNLIPLDDIKVKAEKELNIKLKDDRTCIVTVGRIDIEKAYDRVLDICKALISKKIKFAWYIIGSGPMQEKITERIKNEGLEEYVFLLGHLDNPYPVIRQANLFALLSDYEGLPVTIHEALILGVPVIATQVGGVPEQLCYGNNGFLVKNEYTDILDKMEQILSNPDQINEMKKRIADYCFDNKRIIDRCRMIIGGDD